MGILLSCFDVKDPPARNSGGSDFRNNGCPNVHVTISKRKEIVHTTEVHVVPSSQAQRSAAGVSDTGSSHQVHPDNTPTHQSTQQGTTAELIIDNAAGPSSKQQVLGRQTEIVSCSDQCLVKPSAPEIEGELYNTFPSSDDEDVCPTCLEDYDFENPKIVTRCSHHFHLACIYEWMERSQECPVCSRVMEFDEPA